MHGMAAFERGGTGPGGPGGPDLDDLLAQMFGMGGGMGGMGGGFGGMPGGGGPGQQQARKGRAEVQDYEVSLEELYKGKTTKFASTKNVICATCEGSGGKEGKKGKKCGSCDGKGALLKEYVVYMAGLTLNRSQDSSPTSWSWYGHPRNVTLHNLRRSRILLCGQGQVQEMQRSAGCLAAKDTGTLCTPWCAGRRQDCTGRRSRSSAWPV